MRHVSERIFDWCQQNAQRETQCYWTSFPRCSAHVELWGTCKRSAVLRFVGPPQICRCLVVIRQLSWCSVSPALPLSLSLPASPLTMQVCFIELAVIYGTFVFLLAPAISRHSSDRLKLEVRTFFVYVHTGQRTSCVSNRSLTEKFGFWREAEHRRARGILFFSFLTRWEVYGGSVAKAPVWRCNSIQ